MGYWDTVYLILEYFGILDTGMLWNTGMNLIQVTSLLRDYGAEILKDTECCDTRYRILEYYGILEYYWILEYYGTLNTVILDTGYWDTMGYWVLAYWILDTEYWIMDTGYWILDTGY